MIEGVRWFRNERAVYNAFSMDLAYKVKVGRLFLSPFVGVSINSIGHLNRQELRELERSRFRATGAWQYGLNLEYAFQKVSRKGPFPNEAYPYLRLRGLRRDVQMDRRYEGLEGGNWYLGLSFGFYFREFTTYE